MKYSVLIALLFSLLSIFFLGCNSDDYEEGRFPDTPVNFESINSEYDDYNSAAPNYLYNEFPYMFSSNRNSDGANFDIVDFIVEFHYLPETQKVYFNVLDKDKAYYDTIVSRINTPSNEFGPYMMYSSDYVYEFHFFATDSSGNLDIYYLQNNLWENDNYKSLPLNKINTENNEAYPCFSSDQSEMYFCSDKENNYNIYKVDLKGKSVADWLKTEDLPTWESCDILNSSYNDKCPYVNGDLMVFTSDREGGYGGFDLYYSEFKDGAWTTPVNFGPTINTEYDEYRPIIIYASYYTNDVMLFSSNRPGGLGGYDLYYVGIPKMIL